jgi:hypothetical protein
MAWSYDRAWTNSCGPSHKSWWTSGVVVAISPSNHATAHGQHSRIRKSTIAAGCKLKLRHGRHLTQLKTRNSVQRASAVKFERGQMQKSLMKVILINFVFSLSICTFCLLYQRPQLLTENVAHSLQWLCSYYCGLFLSAIIASSCRNRSSFSSNNVVLWRTPLLVVQSPCTVHTCAPLTLCHSEH